MRAEVLFSNFMAEHNILFLHWLHRLHIASPDSVRPCSLTASSSPCLPVVAPRQHKSSSIPLHHSYIKKSWNICNPVPSPQPMVRATTEIVTRPCPYYCNISDRSQPASVPCPFATSVLQQTQQVFIDNNIP